MVIHNRNLSASIDDEAQSGQILRLGPRNLALSETFYTNRKILCGKSDQGNSFRTLLHCAYLVAMLLVSISRPKESRDVNMLRVYYPAAYTLR